MDLAEFVAGQQASLYAFLYRMTGDSYLSEDLMQETFVRALRASKTYKPQGRLASWLFSIATNLVKDHWRKQRSRNSALIVANGDEFSRGSAEDEAMAFNDIESVRRALLSLPFEQRAPLVLFYYHDLSYEEIAKCLVIPVGTVKSRIHNGKTRVKELLEWRRSQDD